MKDDIDCLKLVKLEFYHLYLHSSTLAKPNTIIENFDKKTTFMQDNLNNKSGAQHSRFDSNCMSSPVRPKSGIQLLILLLV